MAGQHGGAFPLVLLEKRNGVQAIIAIAPSLSWEPQTSAVTAKAFAISLRFSFTISPFEHRYCPVPVKVQYCNYMPK